MQRDKKTRGSMLRFVVLDGLARPTRLDGPGPDALLRRRTASVVLATARRARCRSLDSAA